MKVAHDLIYGNTWSVCVCVCVCVCVWCGVVWCGVCVCVAAGIASRSGYYGVVVGSSYASCARRLEVVV